MRLLCQTNGFSGWRSGVIVGYCPGSQGVLAIVARSDATIDSVPLSSVRVITAPKKLHKFDRELEEVIKESAQESASQ